MTGQDDHNDDGGWGVLFEKAAGSIDYSVSYTSYSATAPIRDDSASSTPNLSIQKSKKRKRLNNEQRLYEKQQSHQDTIQFQAMLESRMDAYHGNNMLGDIESFMSSVTVESKNKNIQLSWPIHLFVCARTIRSYAKVLANSSLRTPTISEQYNNNDGGIFSAIQQNLQELLYLKSTLMSQLPNDEGSLLASKVETLELIAASLIQLTRLKVDNSSHKHKNKQFKQRQREIFQYAVRVVMACDAIYYRLYYSQLTGILPTIYDTSKKKYLNEDISHPNKKVRLFLPHPPEYFLSLIENVNEITKKGSNLFDDDLTRTAIQSIIQNCYNINKTEHHNDHALSLVFKLRWLETIELFFMTGWSQSKHVKKDVIKSLQEDNADALEDLKQHETPAPQLLKEWRDSCRDFMCNIYAYATLSFDTISNLVMCLSRHNISCVLDYGAGTGYITKLLSKEAERTQSNSERQPFYVEAFDILPPPQGPRQPTCGAKNVSAMNEYHGYTPAFYNVQKASNYGNLLSNSNPSRGNKTIQKALLLCYPPPQSSMAYNILQSYLNEGGKLLIHIGEFKGLTGDSQFERLLVEKMQCTNRFPTLTWGTDASHVTVWVRSEGPRMMLAVESQDDADDKTQKLLIPCSTCDTREARKRFRLDRTLAYCSKSCFKKGADARKKQLRLRMIEVDPEICFQFGTSDDCLSL